MASEDAVAQVLSIPDRANASACFGSGWGASGGTEVPPGGRGGGARGGARTRAIAVIEIAPTGVRILPIEDQTSIRIAAITFASAATAILARTMLKLIRG